MLTLHEGVGMPISAINPAVENDFVSENAMSFHVILPGHVEGAIFARLLRGSFLVYHRPIQAQNRRERK